MNDFIIQKYINNITINNIIDYAKKEGIILNNNDAKVIHEYLTKYWKIFYYGDPSNLFVELKEKLQRDTYKKLIELYKMAKEKINN